MISLSDFSVGQDVIVVGSGGRKGTRHAVVVKVGRKYVSVSGGWGEQFFVNDPTSDSLVEKAIYGSPARLYPSETAYRKMLERVELENSVKAACDWYGVKRLSLEQLQRIIAIIQEGAVEK